MNTLITKNELLAWAIGELNQPLDYDQAYGNQCVDYFNFIFVKLFGISPYTVGFGVPGAKDLYDVKYEGFEYIDNSADPNNIPQSGDIIIWDAGAWGIYGHVALCMDANVNTYTVTEQNYNGQPFVSQRTSKYQDFIKGWMRPKFKENAKETNVRTGTNNEMDQLISGLHWLTFGAAPSDAVFADQRNKLSGDFITGSLGIINDYLNHPDSLKNKAGAVDSLTRANKILTDENTNLNKQIASLKAQVGDNTKWETLKALVRELIGK